MSKVDEYDLEQLALSWFENLGYNINKGSALGPGEKGTKQERLDFHQVVLVDRLKSALEKINPDLPPDTISAAVDELTRCPSPDHVENNKIFHKMLTEGVDVPYQESYLNINQDAYRQTYKKIWVFDLENLENNDWLAVNQLTVQDNNNKRRLDIVIFVNGFPLAVLELKKPTDEKATIQTAYSQLQYYKKDIPNIFYYNEILIASDGFFARMGTLTANWDRFMPWRPGKENRQKGKAGLELEPLITSLFQKHRLLDYILNFIVFSSDGYQTLKKAAAYHQFFAVNKALPATFSACGFAYDKQELTGRFPLFQPIANEIRENRPTYGAGSNHYGKHRIGIVWHTQGSGKSLTMAFYAGKIIRHPGMKNPTVVVITDRNDLDDQLFATFCGCKDLLRQRPLQADNRIHLRTLLQRSSGGVIFTTIQKFLPERDETFPDLSSRHNIVVIADEAHRSQYDFIDGYARHLRDALPNASFIGFTATPIETGDRSTPAVFGDYIDTYDVLRAVEDRATVPIYYEARMANIELDPTEKPKIDLEFKEITEGEEESEKRRLQNKWARLEAMVGAEKRIAQVATDIIDHFGKRLLAMDGKGLIVCMSRRICVDMYNALVKLRPSWHHDDIHKGAIKIVMSGSARDSEEWQAHSYSKSEREEIAKRFKDPKDSLNLVIVRDMWLTGFDCPALHTMYVDKPMRAHGLMQAIARVNRVYKDKPGGLVVDYIGLVEQLKMALAQYTQAGGCGKAALYSEEALTLLLEKYEIVVAMFHGFNVEDCLEKRGAERLSCISLAIEHILSLEDGKERFPRAVTALSKAFALAVPQEKALAIRDHIGFFQEVRSHFVKTVDTGDSQSWEQRTGNLDSAIRQLVSRAVSPGEVLDVFTAAGLSRSQVSIFSDSFWQEIRLLSHRNLAVELLNKLLKEEINNLGQRNLVQAGSFSARLEEAIRKYRNRTLEAAAIIEEVIGIAKDMREARERGKKLNLSEDEVAFYDALEVNDSAVKVLGDKALKAIAVELVSAVRRNITIDWAERENARARIRVIVKKILRKNGYPPDKQEKATATVLKQAELLCKHWPCGASSE